MSTEDTAPNLSKICSFPTEMKHCVLMVIARNAAIKKKKEKKKHHFTSEVVKAVEVFHFPN